MKKRVIGILFACILAAGLLPAVAMAQEPESPIPDTAGEVQLDPQEGPEIHVYAGATRYDVSLMIAKSLSNFYDSYPNLEGIIVVSGEDGKFADALSASGLAGLTGYPLVVINGSELSMPDYLTLDTYYNLKGPNFNVIIVGGPNTVSANVEEYLANEYDSTGQCDRISGADRYELNRNIYWWGVDYGMVHEDGWSTEYIVVAKGNDFPDALTIAPFLAMYETPILLVDSAQTGLTEDQKIICEDFDQGVVLGGTASVKPGVQTDLENVVYTTAVERLDGADRYEASANIVDWELNVAWMNVEGVGFATGAKFPDALGCSYYLSLTGRVLCLMNPNGNNTAMIKVLQGEVEKWGSPDNANVFGGTASVPESIYNQIGEGLEWPFWTIDPQ